MAFLGATDGVATMATGVQEHLDAAFLVAHDNDAVLADVIEEEIAGVGDLALVRHEIPGTGEDLLELGLINGPVGEDSAVDGALGRVDHAAEVFAPERFCRHVGGPFFSAVGGQGGKKALSTGSSAVSGAEAGKPRLRVLGSGLAESRAALSQ